MEFDSLWGRNSLSPMSKPVTINTVLRYSAASDATRHDLTQDIIMSIS